VEFKFVLRFGVLLAVVLVVSQFAARNFGSASFVPIAAVTGIADVDPITLTATKLAQQGQVALAAAGILTALAVNMVTKAGIAAVAGGRAFGLRLAPLLGSAVVAGALGLAGASLFRLHSP
jgi:uncharacterized membrane protein (DUF4010 family)